MMYPSGWPISELPQAYSINTLTQLIQGFLHNFELELYFTVRELSSRKIFYYLVVRLWDKRRVVRMATFREVPSIVTPPPPPPKKRQYNNTTHPIMVVMSQSVHWDSGWPKIIIWQYNLCRTQIICSDWQWPLVNYSSWMHIDPTIMSSYQYLLIPSP